MAKQEGAMHSLTIARLRGLQRLESRSRGTGSINTK